MKLYPPPSIVNSNGVDFRGASKTRDTERGFYLFLLLLLLILLPPPPSSPSPSFDSLFNSNAFQTPVPLTLSVAPSPYAIVSIAVLMVQ
jgi:hypothetical protein